MENKDKKNKNTSRRQVTKLDHSGQIHLFEPVPDQAPNPAENQCSAESKFIEPSPSQLSYGGKRLDQFLLQSGQKTPVLVRGFLEQLDWHDFKAAYTPGGRAPYGPMNMMGLVLYGIMKGVNGLRGLEELARVDLGCHWITGGVFPDHSSIGRFITKHDSKICGSFFKTLTKSILKKVGDKGHSLAGDGTLMEAACSHYNLLKEEAVNEQLAKAQNKQEAQPEDKAANKQYEHAKDVAEHFNKRKEARESRKLNTDRLCISATEPDAMVQPLKRNRGNSPSYKPSVVVTEKRIVVGHAVNASSEISVIEELLDQAKTVTGSEAKELLLDAGYFKKKVLSEAIDRQISLLCSPRSESKKASKKGNEAYRKEAFIYDEKEDHYQCPEGETLTRISSHSGNSKHSASVTYRATACGTCAKMSECTKSKIGRCIVRYEGDEVKEAMRMVMEQPRAKKRYQQRQAMVEPVFSFLRGKQQFSKFSRRGLAGVKREFALHILAYNLNRVVALQRGCWFMFGLLFVLFSFVRLEKRMTEIRHQRKGNYAFC